MTWALAAGKGTLDMSCAHWRPHPKAAWLLSTCTPLSSMARISDARDSRTLPFCEAEQQQVGIDRLPEQLRGHLFGIEAGHLAVADSLGDPCDGLIGLRVPVR